jgi:hypothetical protein
MQAGDFICLIGSAPCWTTMNTNVYMATNGRLAAVPLRTGR